MKKLSEMHKRILDFIGRYDSESGYPPSVREICAAVGLKSPSTVHSHLKTLQEAGYLSKDDGKTRSLQLSHAVPENMVPILGYVAAGAQILAVEENIGYAPFSGGSSGFEHFALIIKGESMIDVGILDGDTVIVRAQPTAIHGEIVIALIEDEATCKTLYRKDGEVWLMPENPAYEPIDGRECSILGVVCGLTRRY